MASRTRQTIVDTGVGNKGVSGPWIAVFIVLFAVLTILGVYAVLALWPPSLAEGATDTTSRLTPFGINAELTREQNFLLMVAVLGAIGAMAHVIRSFFKYVGERQLLWSWIPSYLLTPIVG